MGLLKGSQVARFALPAPEAPTSADPTPPVAKPAAKSPIPTPSIASTHSHSQSPAPDANAAQPLSHVQQSYKPHQLPPQQQQQQHGIPGAERVIPPQNSPALGAATGTFQQQASSHHQTQQPAHPKLPQSAAVQAAAAAPAPDAQLQSSPEQEQSQGAPPLEQHAQQEQDEHQQQLECASPIAQYAQQQQAEAGSQQRQIPHHVIAAPGQEALGEPLQQRAAQVTSEQVDDHPSSTDDEAAPSPTGSAAAPNSASAQAVPDAAPSSSAELQADEAASGENASPASTSAIGSDAAAQAINGAATITDPARHGVDAPTEHILLDTQASPASTEDRAEPDAMPAPKTSSGASDTAARQHPGAVPSQAEITGSGNAAGTAASSSPEKSGVGADQRAAQHTEPAYPVETVKASSSQAVLIDPPSEQQTAPSRKQQSNMGSQARLAPLLGASDSAGDVTTRVSPTQQPEQSAQGFVEALQARPAVSQQTRLSKTESKRTQRQPPQGPSRQSSSKAKQGAEMKRTKTDFDPLA